MSQGKIGTTSWQNTHRPVRLGITCDQQKYDLPLMMLPFSILWMSVINKQADKMKVRQNIQENLELMIR